MTLKFNLEDNLDEVGVFFSKDTKQMIVRSVRRSIRLASKRLRSDTIDVIRRDYAFQSKKEVKKFLKERVMLKGNALHRFLFEITVRARGPQLIRFVRGNKSPRNQRGVSPKKRRPLTIEIRPGARRKDRSLFIALASNGNPIVFRRKSNKRPRGSGEILAQRAPAVSRAITPQRRTWLARRAIERMNKAFVADMSFRLQNASGSLKIRARRAA